MKNNAKYREWKQFQKVTSIKRNEERTHTDPKQTQVTLYTEPKYLENVEECLDELTPKNYIISNLNEASDAEKSDVTNVK